MITEFKAGDPVPEWVLRPPTWREQGSAKFGVDVFVGHGSGAVNVWPKHPLKSGESMCRIDWPEGGIWDGAPTLWHHECKDDLLSEG